MSAEEALKEGLREADKIIAEEKATEERKKKEANLPIDEIKKNIDELKNANDALEREQLRQEELRAKAMMGGRAQAGKATEKTPEELANEEAKRMLSMFK